METNKMQNQPQSPITLIDGKLQFTRELKPFETPDIIRFEMICDAMDDGTSRGFQKSDTLNCMKIQSDFWQNNPSLEVLKNVVVEINGKIHAGRITKHDPGNRTFVLHYYNPLFTDLQVYIDSVDKIYTIESIQRELTPKTTKRV